MKKNKTEPFNLSLESSTMDPEFQKWIAQLTEPPNSKPKKLLTKSKAFKRESTKKLIYTLSLKKGCIFAALSTAVIKSNGNYGIDTPFYPKKDCFTNSTELSELDWEILGFILKSKKLYTSNVCLDSPDSSSIIKKIIETGRSHILKINSPPIRWGEPQSAHLLWELESNNEKQKLICQTESPCILLMDFHQPIYYNPKEGIFGFLYFNEPIETIQKLLKMPAIKHEEVSKVQQLISKQVPSLSSLIPKEIKITKINTFSQPCLRLSIQNIFSNIDQNIWGNDFYEDDEDDVNNKYGEEVALFLSFMYDNHKLDFFYDHKKELTISSNDQEIIKIQRDTEKEKLVVDALLEMGWHEGDDYFYKPQDDVMAAGCQILYEKKKFFEERGWKVEIDENFPIQSIYETDEWYVSANESNLDWLDVELGTLVEGERYNLIPALIEIAKRVKRNPEELNFLNHCPPDAKVNLLDNNGKLIIVPVEKLRNILNTFLAEFEDQDSISADQKFLRLSKWHAAVLDEMDKAEDSVRMRWMTTESFREFIDRLKTLKAIPEVNPPLGLQCQLRPYQIAGLSWLQLLSNCQLNGILADDMGLGKTVQTLAHILMEKESGRMKLPVLIVAPTSLVSNWCSEAKKFAPDIKVLPLQGQDRKSLFNKIEEFDLVLTTFPLLLRDKSILLAHEFHLLIVDEAQMIKNARTQSYQILQQLRAKHRLCLTGTPMENHLGEIWSLFNFLLPGYLGNERKFQSLFRKPIEKNGNQARQLALTQRLKPFMLRRTKQQVVKELPDKTEIIQRIDLSKEQRDLYEAVRLKAQEKVMKAIASKGLERSQITILDALLKLRQVCCDPRLLKLSNKSIVESSKLNYLMETITQMIEEKRKIILFSQFTSMLELIEESLKERNIPYTILTGQTKDRKSPVEEFQNGSLPLMLLSLKAGGVGLNLTAADTVIHYDPWWNPAVENQATDRAHRIGQTKAVFVYKLISTGTVEEKILTLQERKKALVSALLESKDTEGLNFSLEDLNHIFQPLT